jgi:hypothetical protein
MADAPNEFVRTRVRAQFKAWPLDAPAPLFEAMFGNDDGSVFFARTRAPDGRSEIVRVDSLASRGAAFALPDDATVLAASRTGVLLRIPTSAGDDSLVIFRPPAPMIP